MTAKAKYNQHSDLLPDLLITIAQEFGTPCYVYNQTQILTNYQSYQQSFENYNHKYLICYAVKANSNLAILNLLAKENCGFDIVSVGELNRVQKAGGACNKIVFSGVGKQDFEISQALDAGILCFNIESEAELILINQIAGEKKLKAPISIRVNPDIDAKSHPYISTGLKEHKFGIDINNAEYIYSVAKNLINLNIIGIDCHIGSQILDIKPLQQACVAINNLLAKLKKNNINITHVNMGGGLGIDYTHDSNQVNNNPTPKLWVNTIVNNLNLTNLKILIEPGRSIIGNAGVLLTKVIYNKTDNLNHHNFIIIDAAMNDLLRPALYSAQHKIINLAKQENHANNLNFNTIVGPVCESSDVFLKNTNLTTKPGDILAILDTGAYGFSMSSNYNSRPRPAEVLITNDNNYFLIRRRETIEQLYAHETILY